MMLFKTALRNSRRYFRRSVVVGICIAISVISLQTMDSIGEGFKQSALRVILEKEGMVVLEPIDDEPLDFAVHSIIGYEEIREKIKEDIPEALIKGIIWSPAVVINDSFSIDALVFSEDDLRGTILGEKTADLLKASQGDTIILMGTNRYGGLSFVPAITDTILSNYGLIRNGRGIAVPLSRARQLLYWNEDEVKRIKVNFRDYWNADIYVEKLRDIFPEMKITSWRERLTNIEDLFKVTDVKMDVFSGIILIIVAGIIMSTILTSVLERKKDIGTLRALGASRFFIISLIVLEIIIIAFIGVLIGTGISYFLIKYILRAGIQIGEMSGVIEYIESVIYPSIVWKNWFGSIFFAMIWAIICSAYPIWFIVRMKPIESLKEV